MGQCGFSGQIIILGFGEEVWAEKNPSPKQVSNQETKPDKTPTSVEDWLIPNRSDNALSRWGNTCGEENV